MRATLGPFSERDVALAFVLAVLPLSLPLFGLEPMHGAALEMTDGTALLVLGSPEAGKSTTAGALRSSGLRFLADDACAVDENGLLWPGPPLCTTRGAEGSDRHVGTFDGKPVEAIAAHRTDPRQVGAVAILSPMEDQRLGVDRLRGRDALVALLGQVRSPWVLAERRRLPQFHAMSTLAQVPIGLVRYDKQRHRPERVAEAVAEWAVDA